MDVVSMRLRSDRLLYADPTRQTVWWLLTTDESVKGDEHAMLVNSLWRLKPVLVTLAGEMCSYGTRPDINLEHVVSGKYLGVSAAGQVKLVEPPDCIAAGDGAGVGGEHPIRMFLAGPPGEDGAILDGDAIWIQRRPDAKILQGAPLNSFKAGRVHDSQPRVSWLGMSKKDNLMKKVVRKAQEANATGTSALGKVVSEFLEKKKAAAAASVRPLNGGLRRETSVSGGIRKTAPYGGWGRSGGEGEGRAQRVFMPVVIKTGTVLDEFDRLEMRIEPRKNLSLTHTHSLSLSLLSLSPLSLSLARSL